MSLLAIIAKWAGIAGPELIRWLELAKNASPDAAPKIDSFISALHEVLSAENLASKVGLILTEMGNIGRGKFEGRSHPGDLA